MVLNEGLEALGPDYPGSRLGMGAFEGSAVGEVLFPSTLRVLRYASFARCGNLRHLALPEGLETIGRRCFWGSAVEAVAVPDSVTEIAEDAFRGCAALTSVAFGERSRLARIGVGAFGGTALEEFLAPPALRVLAQAAFYRCLHLRRVELNEGLEVLGADEKEEDRSCYGVFEESAVEDVRLPDSLKRIESRAFEGCKGLK